MTGWPAVWATGAYSGPIIRPRKPILRRRIKVGRNCNCPCGSGLKHKRCHWRQWQRERAFE